MQWGLAGRLADDPRAAARDLARTLADRDPTAMRLAKQIIDAAEDDRSLAAERAAEALLYHRRAAAKE